MSNLDGMKTSNEPVGIEIAGERTNPFSETGASENGPADEELVSKAQAGDKDALET